MYIHIKNQAGTQTLWPRKSWSGDIKETTKIEESDLYEDTRLGLSVKVKNWSPSKYAVQEDDRAPYKGIIKQLLKLLLKHLFLNDNYEEQHYSNKMLCERAEYSDVH